MHSEQSRTSRSLDEAYVFLGFRFALIAVIAALVVMPLLVALRSAAYRLCAALSPATLANSERVAVLNRVQLETRSASLPKPPGGRRSDPKSTDLELDAV